MQASTGNGAGEESQEVDRGRGEDRWLGLFPVFGCNSRDVLLRRRLLLPKEDWEFVSWGTPRKRDVLLSGDIYVTYHGWWTSRQEKLSNSCTFQRNEYLLMILNRLFSSEPTGVWHSLKSVLGKLAENMKNSDWLRCIISTSCLTSRSLFDFGFADFSWVVINFISFFSKICN